MMIVVWRNTEEISIILDHTMMFMHMLSLLLSILMKNDPLNCSLITFPASLYMDHPSVFLCSQDRKILVNQTLDTFLPPICIHSPSPCFSNNFLTTLVTLTAAFRLHLQRHVLHVQLELFDYELPNMAIAWLRSLRLALIDIRIPFLYITPFLPADGLTICWYCILWVTLIYLISLSLCWQGCCRQHYRVSPLSIGLSRACYLVSDMWPFIDQLYWWMMSSCT